jgi:hypothetical protein
VTLWQQATKMMGHKEEPTLGCQAKSPQSKATELDHQCEVQLVCVSKRRTGTHMMMMTTMHALGFMRAQPIQLPSKAL